MFAFLLNVPVDQPAHLRRRLAPHLWDEKGHRSCHPGSKLDGWSTRLPSSWASGSVTQPFHRASPHDSIRCRASIEDAGSGTLCRLPSS
jgi:hypothetical protein